MGDKESFQEFEFDWYSWFAIASLFGGAVIFTDKCLQTQNISTEIIQKKKKFHKSWLTMMQDNSFPFMHKFTLEIYLQTQNISKP